MDGRIVVAYGLHDGLEIDFPVVPDYLVLRQRDRYWRLDQSGEADVGAAWYRHAVVHGLVSEIKASPWIPGSSAIVEESGIIIFPKEEEPERRAAMAKELVNQASSVKGNPERSLSLLRAAGKMVEIPVGELVSKLESARERPEESLLDIYRRVR